jgi:hypothetical protein
MKRPARVPSQLSESLRGRLNAYTLAASAAGVGVLALVQPVGAKIVYTKIHRVVSINNPHKLDLNHDRTTDFLIQEIGNGFSSDRLLAKEEFGNAVQGSITQGMHYASALKARGADWPSPALHQRRK